MAHVKLSIRECQTVIDCWQRLRQEMPFAPSISNDINTLNRLVFDTIDDSTTNASVSTVASTISVDALNSLLVEIENDTKMDESVTLPVPGKSEHLKGNSIVFTDIKSSVKGLISNAVRFY